MAKREMSDLYSRAEDEAERRGCVLENDCWRECVEAALNDLTPPASGASA